MMTEIIWWVVGKMARDKEKGYYLEMQGKDRYQTCHSLN